MCSTGVTAPWSGASSAPLKCFHVVQAWGMLLWCLRDTPVMVTRHPILVAQPLLSIICCDWTPKHKCFDFIFTQAFPPINLPGSLDVGMSKELYELTEWQLACLQDVPYVLLTLRGQADHLSEVSSLFIRIQADELRFFWICEAELKKTKSTPPRALGKLLMWLLTCIGEVGALEEHVEYPSVLGMLQCLYFIWK